ncbi:trigger factor [Thiohalophilus thiocyanatoxydans]|uniref:Trigger factor n=1 Tax=Thiohalophilus thiocyanatoxydans TaxID=381308 RepID=A0A4R8IHI3_9GAMM|nr:trigger factor [Thiohalophilus thiocyanatoxydans]TDY00071.1 trigger factor [Thiohalophilus thiocyanatoxydans]
MQVSVETTEGLERRMTVNVDEERIASAVDDRLKNMTHTVKLKGFRKGKVPFKVVKQQYGKQVREEVVGEVLQSTFYEAVSQQQLQPAGTPNFDDLKHEAGEGLSYTATFEIYPAIELAPLAEQTVEKPVTEIGEADIDRMIETIRKQNMDWQTVDREAKEGDRVNLDFKGMIDGEVFEGGSGQGMQVELGSGRMIPGFEDGLLGARAGEDRTLEVTFPENYHAAEMAGKPAVFETHINSIEEPVLPEVDAEFAKKLGVESGDLSEMRNEIRDNMQRELDTRLRTRLKEAVMDTLLAANPIEAPKSLIENEERTLLQQMLQNLASQGMQQQDLSGINPEMFREQAQKRVTLGLIMSEIVKANDLKVSPEAVKARVEEIAAPYEHPEEVVKWYQSDRQRMSEVESLVFEDQVVDWVLDQARVIEKPVSFDEIMTSENAQ